jgi:hypothetical protein
MNVLLCQIRNACVNGVIAKGVEGVGIAGGDWDDAHEGPLGNLTTRVQFDEASSKRAVAVHQTSYAPSAILGAGFVGPPGRRRTGLSRGWRFAGANRCAPRYGRAPCRARTLIKWRWSREAPVRPPDGGRLVAPYVRGCRPAARTWGRYDSGLWRINIGWRRIRRMGCW